MMKTPIFDFIKAYNKRNPIRFHMPGHKGKGSESFYKNDITEIDGADVLYSENGIIAESQGNASEIFGTAKTLYSTEGSSLCIRGMLYLIKHLASSQNKRCLILAPRNAHKTFITACALLDIDISWIYSENDNHISFKIDYKSFEQEIKEKKPTAVYITSPDYLGNIQNIKKISELSHKYGSILMVDNAHGSYLKFLEKSLHPIDLGADICCDSAHKTLPVLTGGAYLHISKNAPKTLKENAENALSLFASTSPSYLILQSLDLANGQLASNYKKRLYNTIKQILNLKKMLLEKGYCLIGDEPLKITISTKEYGYYGYDFSRALERKNIFCEFSDPDFIVMMFSINTTKRDIKRLTKILLSLPKLKVIKEKIPKISIKQQAISPKKALEAKSEKIACDSSLGRILASSNVHCPPAIPIVMCGEIIDENAIECFKYYGIDDCMVLLND